MKYLIKRNFMIKKTLIIAVLLLSGCTVQLEDKRIDPQIVAQALNQQAAVIDEIVTQLSAQGLLKAKEDKKK